ncbi:MAG: ABC transporter substrate-binding protein [Alphaproteobacteria bacterium]|nr:ABC transporter substrate-binding protein [Alphaproteobacteria bacterium]MDX5368897.1 ABC transporter substrate-binding protein [Alphaproteobacteria bacterium]MDX5463621.1 ABC transporter substrate-binding protein [Alphaproteobacteria bacterium]
MIRTTFISGLAAAAMLAVSAAPASAETGVTDDTIVLGGMTALTGTASNLTRPQIRAAAAVFAEVNDAGGIHGRKIEFIMEDDECLPSKGVGAVKKLLHVHQPFMIVGGGCSNAAIAQKPEIVAAKIPWLILGSTADSLSEPMNPYIFTTYTAAWMEGYAQLQYALDQGAKRIAVVWQSDAWGKARIDPMRKALESKGIEAVAYEELAPDPTDTTPAVLRVQAQNPDAVILMLFPKAGIPWLRDAYKIGFKPLTVGPSPMSEVDVIAKGVGTEDALSNFVGLSTVGYTTDAPEVAKWKEIIERRFPDSNFSSWHMVGVAAGQFTVEALRRAGRDLTREKVLEVLSTLEMQPDTYAGPLKCTPQDHQCHRTLAAFAVKDGKVSRVGVAVPKR